MYTKYQMSSTGPVEKDIANELALASSVGLLSKAMKGKLTPEEKAQLDANMVFLTNLKDESGKSVVIESMNEVIDEIKKKDPKTLDELSQIILDELKQDVNETASETKGGKRRSKRKGGNGEEAAGGGTLKGVAKIVSVLALLSQVAYLGVGTKVASDQVSVASSLLKIDRKAYCYEEALNYVPPTGPFALLYRDPVLEAHAAKCAQLTVQGLNGINNAYGNLAATVGTGTLNVAGAAVSTGSTLGWLADSTAAFGRAALGEFTKNGFTGEVFSTLATKAEGEAKALDDAKSAALTKSAEGRAAATLSSPGPPAVAPVKVSAAEIAAAQNQGILEGGRRRGRKTQKRAPKRRSTRRRRIPRYLAAPAFKY